MVPIDPIEGDDQSLEPFDNDLWAQQMDFQWELRFEQYEPPIKGEIIQIDVGEQSSPKGIFISKNLSDEDKQALIELIKEYINIFACSYVYMPGLDPRIATHKLNILPNIKPVKQQQQGFCPDMRDAIEAEVKKLIACGFVPEEQYPDWVANMVQIMKKNGKVQVRIDYGDLNSACPKDKFPLPITVVMIDNTCGFKHISFMDEFSEYNQIKMFLMTKNTHLFEHRWEYAATHGGLLAGRI